MSAIPTPVAVYALTAGGANVARRIAAGLPGAVVFLPERLARPDLGERSFGRLAAALAANFQDFRGHVAAAAAGIVVRALAPLLGDKTRDPAVVVVDPEGRFAVSLLSGHLGGANDLARETARILGGQAVVTTATDAAGKPGLEVIARDQGLRIENMKALSRLSRAIVEDDPVPVFDPGDWLRPALAAWPETFSFLTDPPPLDLDAPLVYVGQTVIAAPDSWLLIRPPSLAVGLGCNRGTSVEELDGLLIEVFETHGLSRLSIRCLATIAAKRDETGILALAERLGVETIFFEAMELGRVRTPHPSAAVEKHMGVASVCEAAAMLAAGTDRLLAAKHKSRNATLAAAETSSWSSAWGPAARKV